ncbi:hypothetical protein B0G69_2253 [Paraburkholderia sp. RAU2J]|uniref:hypothetical protein n=1 Tax=Paraburkholderia sp. RAU2J TaxID=1938810 RepID=UPI000F202074|nr:hypothetical protein [Paraburkholderia sp. RAU2J]RKT26506.1 hypothetical protein B0G69_2253 [Paraburkholderia sp. RAU2J]
MASRLRQLKSAGNLWCRVVPRGAVSCRHRMSSLPLKRRVMLRNARAVALPRSRLKPDG